MEEQEIQDVAAQEAFPLDEAAIGLISEIDQQAAQMQAQLDAQLRGILALFIRQHSLQGKWQLAPNKRELVKAP